MTLIYCFMWREQSEIQNRLRHSEPFFEAVYVGIIGKRWVLHLLLKLFFLLNDFILLEQLSFLK